MSIVGKRTLTPKFRYTATWICQVLPHKLVTLLALNARLEPEVKSTSAIKWKSIPELGKCRGAVSLHPKAVRMGNILPGLPLQIVKHGRHALIPARGHLVSVSTRGIVLPGDTRGKWSAREAN